MPPAIPPASPPAMPPESGDVATVPEPAPPNANMPPRADAGGGTTAASGAGPDPALTTRGAAAGRVLPERIAAVRHTGTSAAAAIRGRVATARAASRRAWGSAHPNTRGAVAVAVAAVISLGALAVILPAGAPQAQTPPGPPVTVPTKSAATLVCPVDGVYTFRDDFAEPRSGKRTHHGNDVFAAKGTPLRAIVGGTIEKAVPVDDGTLGGARIWIAGDDGWHYYYAHMSRVDVAKGQRVAAADVVGAVGNTGDAKTTPPHLHFEQHFRQIDGPFVDPHATLVAACPHPVAKLPASALATD